jgi:FkbM family methyltransferase
MKYYCSEFEDRFIHRFFDLPEKGVFVDVGAGDGISESNTYFFEKLGWDGICIDADPRHVASLKKHRKRWIKALVSNSHREVVAFYMNKEDPTVSGIVSNEQNRGVVEYPGPVRLEAILEGEGIGKIDLLSIDTEGSELDVLESMDLKEHDPEIIIVEYITHTEMNWEAVFYLEDAGYKVEATKGANQIMRKVKGSKVI